MVIAAMFGQRSEAVKMAPDLKEAADWHHRIYRAIREHKPEDAQLAMQDHLKCAHEVWKQVTESS
jgi:DNA-binding FadR family transcriptional regulator